MLTGIVNRDLVRGTIWAKIDSQLIIAKAEAVRFIYRLVLLL